MNDQARASLVPEVRVLVVDDEEDIRSALGRYLTLVGYRVEVAASGQEALAILDATRHQVAIVDIRMAGMGGVEFVRLAHEQCSNLAIVFLTGNATLGSAIAAVKAHAADYLLKPASAETVANAVAAALDKQRLVTEVPAADGERYVRAGSLTLDRQSDMVSVEGASSATDRHIALTPSEAALLACLMDHPRMAVSCRELARVALHYNLDEREAQAIVRPHVSRLRKKLEPEPARPRCLRTVPGAGYCLWPQAAVD